MELVFSEILDYLVNKQGYDAQEIMEMPVEEVIDLYELYLED